MTLLSSSKIITALCQDRRATQEQLTFEPTIGRIQSTWTALEILLKSLEQQNSTFPS